MKEFKPFEIDTEIEIRHSKNKRILNKNNPKKKDVKKDISKKKVNKPRKISKKMKRRRRTTVVIFALLVVLFVLGAWKKFFKEEPTPFTAHIGSWYIGKFMEENRNYYNTTPYYEDINELSTIAQDSMVNFERKIMPGYAHLITANKYAYDTKEIRQYIRGEKQYTGKDKLVFLTFDDGPNRTITPKVLEILKEKGVRGTFFLVGRNMTDKNINVMRTILNNENSIAIHSYSHDYGSLYPDRKASTLDLLSEAKLCNQRLQEIFGSDIHSNVWRYPGGHMSWEEIYDADDGLSKMGIEWIDWNCLAGDAEIKRLRPTTADGMVEYVITSLNKNLHNNVAVVLMHDAVNKSMTVEALPKIIDYFLENNYKFGILK